MSTITAILEPDADGTLHLPLPAELRHQTIKVIAQLEPMPLTAARAEAGTGRDLKGFGCLQGEVWTSPDFDEPLDDFKDYV